MTRGRRSGSVPKHRPQRRRVFIGCEGESERGYAALLQTLLDDRNLPFHLDIAVLNPGAGDPLELVKRAVAKSFQSAERHGVHAFRAVLLDSDRHAKASPLGRRTAELARENEILLVWQEPCHEALVLRHLDGCRTLRPSTSIDALRSLSHRWPAYEKPMSRVRLATLLDGDAILRAAGVEPELRHLLRFVGFVRDR